MKTEFEIREAVPGDARELLAIYKPYVETTAITFEYEVPSRAEFEERIRHTKKKYPYLVACRGEEILGYACAGAFKGRAAYDWAVETSIYVRKGLGRQGIGSGLYAALENMLKQQNIVNLYACIAAPEKEDEYLTRNSILFHERLGYELIGEFHKCGYKFGRWYNMVWMEKMIGEHLPDQPPVIWTDK